MKTHKLLHLLCTLLLACSCSGGSDTTPGGVDDIVNSGDPTDGTDSSGGTVSSLALDTALAETGWQGVTAPSDIGPEERVGFAVYVRDIEQYRAFSISVTWDGAKADWLGSISGPQVPDETMTLNGAPVTFAAEPNILDQTAAIGEVDEPGRYATNVAKLGGTAPRVTDYAPVFFCAFKTDASFSATDSLTVRVDLTVSDDAGALTVLEPVYFTVNP